ncbi:Ig-like domain-containing protein, partial [Clostridium frigidicarnis]
MIEIRDSIGVAPERLDFGKDTEKVSGDNQVNLDHYKSVLDGGQKKEIEEDTSESTMENNFNTYIDHFSLAYAGLMDNDVGSLYKDSISNYCNSIPRDKGIWIIDKDRKYILEKINKATDKTYFIDDNGYLKEDIKTPINSEKSKIYSSILDTLIKNYKVIIGKDFGFTTYNDKEDKYIKSEFKDVNSKIFVNKDNSKILLILNNNYFTNSTSIIKEKEKESDLFNSLEKLSDSLNDDIEPIENKQEIILAEEKVKLEFKKNIEESKVRTKRETTYSLDTSSDEVMCTTSQDKNQVLFKTILKSSEVTKTEDVKDGWVTIDGEKYYYKDGKPCVGLILVGDKYYYMDSDGKMQTGWQTIDGKRYYFYEDGSMARNTTIDGWNIDDYGVATNVPRINVELPEDENKITTNFNIYGWALNPSGIKEVNVYIDDKFLGKADTGIERLDVDNAFPGYIGGNKSGFNYDVDINTIPQGKRKILVKAIGNDGTSIDYIKFINVEKLPLKIQVDIPSEEEEITKEFSIYGWALNPSGMNKIDVYIDDEFLGKADINIERSDIESAFPGYIGGDKSGFNYNVDINKIPPGQHKILVRAIGNDGTSIDYIRIINIKKLPLKIWVEFPNENEEITQTKETQSFPIEGWALNPSGIKVIDIYIDGKFIGKANMGIEREDINYLFPGYLDGDKSGFNYIIDLNKISAGYHKVLVRATGNDGTYIDDIRNITINKLPLKIYIDSPEDKLEVTQNKTNSSLDISGWALNQSGIKAVDIYLDSKFLGTSSIGRETEDLDKMYPGYLNGDKAGFDYSLDLLQISEGEHEILTRAIGNDGTTLDDIRTIKINKLKPLINVESPINGTITSDGISINGWALNASGINRVEVYLDGDLVGNAHINMERKDVDSAFPGYINGENSGFAYMLNTDYVPQGYHIISVKAFGNDGSMINQEKTFTRVQKNTTVELKVETYGLFGENLQWSDFCQDGAYGPIDKPIQAIKIMLNNGLEDMDIKYQVYIKENKTWEDWKSNGEQAGEIGKTIQAIRIKLDGSTYGYSIKYITFTNKEAYKEVQDGEISGSFIEGADGIVGVSPILCKTFMSIDKDTTWTKDEGPKKFDCVVEVKENVTLTIEPGVEILFNNEEGLECGLIVAGKVIANGDDLNKIKIISAANNTNFLVTLSGTLDGNNIIIQTNEVEDDCVLRNYGALNLNKVEMINKANGNKGTAIFSKSNNEVNIFESKFENFDRGVKKLGSGRLVIANSKFLNNHFAIEVLVEENNKNKDGIIIDNNFIEGNEYGINIAGGDHYDANIAQKVTICGNYINLSKSAGIHIVSKLISNINIYNNQIVRSGLTKTTDKLVALGPICITNTEIKEDKEDIFSTINPIDSTRANIVQGNNYDGIILNNVTISSNITIEKGHNDYIAQNGVYVKKSFKIGKGVIIKSKNSKYPLFEVTGQLLLNGTNAEPVVITSINDDRYPLGHINTNDEDDNKISYISIFKDGSLVGNNVIMRNCGKNDEDASIFNSGNLVLNNSTIENLEGIGTQSYDNLNINSSTIKSTSYGVENAVQDDVIKSSIISFNSGNLVLNNSTIENLSDLGFGVESYGNLNINSSTIKNTYCGVQSKGQGNVINSSIINCKHGVCNYGTLLVNRSKIDGGSVGIEATTDNETTILESQILNCDRGILVLKGKANIINNKFENYNEYGITLCYQNDYQILYNSFIANTSPYNSDRYAILSIPSGVIKVQYNYWNSQYGPNKDGETYNPKKGEYVKGEIDYSNYLSEPTTVNLDIDLNEYQKQINDYINQAEYSIQRQFGQEGINVATGNYSKKVMDISITSPGIPIEIYRTYNSRSKDAGEYLGKGWRFSYESNIKDIDSSFKIPGKVVTLPDGGVQSFKLNDDNTFTALDSRNRLEKINNQYVLISKTNDRFTFDNDVLIEIRDKNNNVLKISYDENKKINKIYNESGIQCEFSYSNGKLASITESVNGIKERSITYNYSNNLLESVNDVNGNIVEIYEYDYESRLKNIKIDGQSIESVSYYDDDENKSKIATHRDELGNENTYTYDNNKRIVVITDSNKRFNEMYYDNSMNVVLKINPDGTSETVEYFLDENGVNKFGETKSSRDKNGNSVKYEYDKNGNTSKQINPDGGIKYYFYDDKNNLIKEIDETDKKTFYIYDENKINIVKIIKPINGTDEYDGTNDNNFLVSKIEYYSSEELKSIGCAINGLIKRKVNPEGGIQQFSHDKFGNVIQTIDEEGHIIDMEYNNLGQKIKEKVGNKFETQYKYDNKGILLETTYDNGSKSKTIYDIYGRKIKEISPNLYADFKDSKGKTYTYYENGKVKSITNEEGYTTEFTYDVYGNMETAKQANGAYNIFKYDDMNRAIKKYFKDNINSNPILLEEYEYNIDEDYSKDSKIRTIKKTYSEDNKYSVIEQLHDFRDNIIEQTDEEGVKTKTYYNLNGTKAYEMDENQSITYYEYDGLNRLVKVLTPVKGESNDTVYSSVTFQYDRNGNKVKEILGKDLVKKDENSSEVITNEHSYYKNGKLKSNYDDEGRKTEFEYDEANNLIKQIVTINSNNEKNIIEYENNYLGKPIKQIEYVKAGDIYGNEINDDNIINIETEYDYDLNGNMIKKLIAGYNETNYKYDKLNREIAVEEKSLSEPEECNVIETTKVYDWKDDIIIEVDGNGNSTAERYNPRGFLESHTDGNWGITRFYYDLQGRLVERTAVNNNNDRIRYIYNNKGLIIGELNVTYENEEEITAIVTKAYKYDKKGNKIKELDALGFDKGVGTSLEEKIDSGYGIEYEYNLKNQLIKMLEPEDKAKNLNFTYMYDYDGMGRKIREEDSKDHIFEFEYNNSDKLLNKKFILGNKSIELERYEYDLLDNIITKFDGNGNKTIIEMNSLNKPRKIIFPDDNSIDLNIITYQYDIYGNEVFNQDTLGKTHKCSFDYKGNLLKEVECDSNGKSEIIKEFKYDKNGNKIFEKDGNGNFSEYIYDALDKLKVINFYDNSIAEKPVIRTKTYEYNSDGKIVEETNYMGNTTSYKYDNLGRLIEKYDGEGILVEKLEYYQNGCQSKSIDALGNVKRFEYDKNNRLIATIDGEENKIIQGYDSLGNVEYKADGNGNKTVYGYDELNRLKSVLNPKKELTIYNYDNNGNLIEQIEGNGNKTTFVYNVANKKIKTIESSINEEGISSDSLENLTYDSSGNIKTKKDRNGKVTIFTYDIHGRIISEGVGDLSITFDYDNNGNQISLKDATGTTIREFDGLNRAISKEVPAIGKSTYVYENIEGLENGHYEEITIDPKGNTTKKVYNKADRLIRVIADNKTTTYEYCLNGNRKTIIYPDGSREEYEYNKDNRLKTLTNKKAENEILEIFNYKYDSAGNITSKTDKKGITSYSYDELNRLLTVTEPDNKETSYLYDKSGNRISKTLVEKGVMYITTYSYNEKNRLISTVTKDKDRVLGFKNYEYDNNGNIIKEISANAISDTVSNDVSNDTSKFNINTVEYVYDDLNQQIEAKDENGVLVKNTYNGEGLRVSKESKEGKTHFLYEGDKVILEVQDKTLLEKGRNVYGLNLLMRKVGDTEAYYMYNGHGDVTNLLDGTGKIIGSYYYDAFGKVEESTSDISNPYKYAGYQYDEEIGKYYLKSRMYDPETARFMQEDTYRGDKNDPLSLNLYTYCENNPLIYDDQNGHWP